MDIVAHMDVFILLFLTALAAGFLDAIAGGGGLITIPALLLTGIHPLAALATNKLQSVSGTFSSSLIMIRKGQVSPGDIVYPFFTALAGAGLGSFGVQFLNLTVLDIVIPIALVSVALYFLFAPKIRETASKPLVSTKTYANSFVPVIGLYDGAFGPGTGSFFTLAGTVLRGKTLVGAVAEAKCLNFATNLASLCVFLFSGYMVWSFGFVMMAGQIIGSYLGAHTMLKGGARLIRPMIVLACLAMLAKTLYTKFF